MTARFVWPVMLAGLLALPAWTPTAQERWVYRYNGPASSWDAARCIIMGPDGNLYAAGESYGIGVFDDFTVLSLTDSGSDRWVYRYDGPGSDHDVANCVVAGADSNLYAAGYSTGSGTYRDFTVISLTDSGDERWVYRYDGSGNVWDEAHSIIIGSDGNLYAAGRSYRGGAPGDFTVISLTDSGDERWVYHYDGSVSGWNKAYSIVMGLTETSMPQDRAREWGLMMISRW